MADDTGKVRTPAMPENKDQELAAGSLPTTGRGAGGESGGGAYPNPHTGKSEEAKKGGFGDHGGQSEIGYYGGGQLGGRAVDSDDSNNAGAKKG